MIEPAKKKADILAAVATARAASDLLAQVTEVAAKFKDVAFVKVDVEGAKKASDDATKAADEAAKALAEDKPFTEEVTKLKAGPVAEANAVAVCGCQGGCGSGRQAGRSQ